MTQSVLRDRGVNKGLVAGASGGGGLGVGLSHANDGITASWCLRHGRLRCPIPCALGTVGNLSREGLQNIPGVEPSVRREPPLSARSPP